MLQFTSIAVSGVTIAMTLFLSAAGLTLLFGILRILNFAQGTFIMVGAYVAAALLGQAAFGPEYFIFSALVAGAVIGVIGLGVDLLVFRRLRHVDEAVALIATFALMLAVQGAAKLIFGPNFVSISPPSSFDGAYFLGGVIIPQFSVFIIGIGIVTFVVLEIIMTRLWLGKILRSVASDSWIMSVLGFDTRIYMLIAVGIAFFLAGFAGGVLVPNQTLQPTLGESFILQAFTVVIVGGLGSIRGAFVASILLGFAEAIGSIYFPSMALYIAIIVILLVRPQGLMPMGMLAASSGIGTLFSRGASSADLAEIRAARNAAKPQAASRIVAGAGKRFRKAGFSLSLLIGVAIAAVTLLVPFWGNQGILFIAGFVLIQALFAMSWNLLFGYAGMATFGHAAFYGIGSYTIAVVLKLTTGIPFLVGLAGAGVIAIVVAGFLGVVALRRSGGLQLAILTLAFAEIFRILVSYNAYLGHDEGISAIPRPNLDFGIFSISLQSASAYYWFLCVAFALIALLLWWISHSAFGRTLRSIHQDRERAAFIGINVDRYRLFAFVIGSTVAAVVGGLAVPLTQLVTPESASVAKSTAPMLNTLLGGAGTFWGPAVGALAFSVVEYGTRTLAGMSEFITGVILLLIVLLAPTGLLGLLQALGGKVAQRAGRNAAPKHQQSKETN